MNTDREISLNGKKAYKAAGLILAFLCLAVLSGCRPEEGAFPEAAVKKEKSGTWRTGSEESGTGLAELQEFVRRRMEPEQIEADWSEYFQGLNGAAVLYDAEKNRMFVYQPALAKTRRSPCSTFKIISSLLALENDVIDPEHSVRRWSGEMFWNGEWNRDIGFEDAFRASCVWYFREVTDEIGKERMQEGLNRLRYGNCDISDWEGRLNTNNSNRALTGFWIESSLKISPIEQTRVMERIFGQDGYASRETVERLKQVMLTKEEGELAIYGKTGMGKENGVTVDAWFTGFAETPEGKRYFCVYLGRSDGIEATSTAAKELAVRIVTDHWKMEVS